MFEAMQHQLATELMAEKKFSRLLPATEYAIDMLKTMSDESIYALMGRTIRATAHKQTIGENNG